MARPVTRNDDATTGASFDDPWLSGVFDCSPIYTSSTAGSLHAVAAAWTFYERSLSARYVRSGGA
ncbi:MAG: hypothetical protein MUF54_15280, partial [Polyangiaceae bacterium]|nr:hypothetical protein [Polyangiaceae bacterium]